MVLHLAAETESTHQRHLPLLLLIHVDYSSSHHHSPPQLPHTHHTSLKETAIGGGSRTEAVHTWQKHHHLFVTCTNVFMGVSTHSNKCTRSHPKRARISLLSFLSTFEKMIVLFSLAVTQSKTSSHCNWSQAHDNWRATRIVRSLGSLKNPPSGTTFFPGTWFLGGSFLQLGNGRAGSLGSVLENPCELVRTAIIPEVLPVRGALSEQGRMMFFYVNVKAQTLAGNCEQKVSVNEVRLVSHRRGGDDGN